MSSVSDDARGTAAAGEQAVRRAPGPLALVAFTFLVWLTHVQMPVQGTPDDNDNSWSRALAYAFVHKLQAGVDWLFTAGPLGTFHNVTYEPELYWTNVIVWQCGIKLLAAIALVRAFARLDGALERLAFGCALVAVPISNDAYALLALLAACTWIVERTSLARPGVLAMLVLFSAFALAKFTLFTFVLGCVAAIAWYFARERSLRSALCFVGAYVCVQAAAWKLAGQALANLPRYLALSWQITSGYNDAMSFDAPGDEAALGLWTLSIAVVLAALAIGTPLRSRRRALQAALMLLAFFVMHKAGFTRGDHGFIFFGFAAAAPYVVAAPLAAGAWQRALSVVLRLACVVLCAIGVVWQAAADIPPWRRLAASWAGSATEAAIGLSGPEDWRRARQDELERVARAFDLPRVRERVGRRTIDAISWEQSLLFVNGLEWKPRLTFQSYSAYTRELALENARCYAGPDAPDFVLFKMQTIDWRLPTLDDGPLLRVLARDYEPVLVEGGCLLLEHRPRTDPGPPDETLLDRSLRFEETLELGDLPGACRILSIEIEKTWWGKLRTFFDKAPPLAVELELNDGTARTYRIVPEMIAVGAIIDPLIERHKDWENWLRGTADEHVVRLRLLAPAHPAMYASEVRVRIERSDRCVPRRVEDIEAILFNGLLPSVPTTISAEPLPVRVEVDADPALLVNAPSEIRCALDAGAHRLTTAFGLVPRSYYLGDTDGASFSVVVRERSGAERVLFERTLDPKQVEADRGTFALELDFELEQPAELCLRTGVGAHGDARSDRAYWRAIELH